MAGPRTFTLQSPLMHGDDVAAFQRDIASRFASWGVHRHVADDGVYGTATRDAARDLCTGLGIVPEDAMRHGVTPELRGKVRDLRRRTPQEVARSESTSATAFRAKLRERFKDAATFDGKPVAAWIVPSLRWARDNGWTGAVTSGHRTCEHQRVVAEQYARNQGKTVAQIYPHGPCASNHVGIAHPKGAVDVSEPEQLARVLRDNPHRPTLVWGGLVIEDAVHFSADGH